MYKYLLGVLYKFHLNICCFRFVWVLTHFLFLFGWFIDIWFNTDTSDWYQSVRVFTYLQYDLSVQNNVSLCPLWHHSLLTFWMYKRLIKSATLFHANNYKDNFANKIRLFPLNQIQILLKTYTFVCRFFKLCIINEKLLIIPQIVRRTYAFAWKTRKGPIKLQNRTQNQPNLFRFRLPARTIGKHFTNDWLTHNYQSIMYIYLRSQSDELNIVQNLWIYLNEDFRFLWANTPNTILNTKPAGARW